MGTENRAARSQEEVTYYCDSMRHLVCLPYSVENLHKMAEDLGIKKCWFHSGRHKHYDIPLKKIEHVLGRAEVVSPRRILEIIKTGR